MTLMQLLILLVVAGVCGSIGRAIAGYSHGGCLVSIAWGLSSNRGVVADALNCRISFSCAWRRELDHLSIIGSHCSAVISLIAGRRKMRE
jgi:uncharacterized membrane protein YeaQ/YmgE (transglycosylase-associated protein family)